MSNKISKEIEITLNSLRARGMNAIFAEDREAAGKLVMEMVPENSIIAVSYTHLTLPTTPYV